MLELEHLGKIVVYSLNLILRSSYISREDKKEDDECKTAFTLLSMDISNILSYHSASRIHLKYLIIL